MPIELIQKNCFRNVPLFSSKGHLQVAFLCVEKMAKERLNKVVFGLIILLF